uniref:IlGF domain-containing protein n=1 Tax=Steinernema glaseri TaxID=37863 RepID=A0A1I8AEU1_9BILA
MHLQRFFLASVVVFFATSACGFISDNTSLESGMDSEMDKVEQKHLAMKAMEDILEMCGALARGEEYVKQSRCKKEICTLGTWTKDSLLELCH